MAPIFIWDPDKNAELNALYGFGFERLLVALSEGALLADRTHPNTARYGHQKQLIVEIEGYAWIAPFVQQEDTVFLKTMFPSRKAKRLFLERPHEESSSNFTRRRA